jgi:hypothetical protein
MMRTHFYRMYLVDIFLMILYFIVDISFSSYAWYGKSLMHEQVQGSLYGSTLFIFQRR